MKIPLTPRKWGITGKQTKSKQKLKTKEIQEKQTKNQSNNQKRNKITSNTNKSNLSYQNCISLGNRDKSCALEAKPNSR